MEKTQTNDYPEKLLKNMISLYFENRPWLKSQTQISHELETRFGTRKIKLITKTDYDNVIKKLKSLGFQTTNDDGNYMLRIYNEYISKSGNRNVSKIRTEINTFNGVREYCKTNDINVLLKSSVPYYNVKFVKKEAVKDKNNYAVQMANFNDFNFRVSYQTEEEINPSSSIVKLMLNDWLETKKDFRFINRVSFQQDDNPVIVDISIVKTNTRQKNGMTKLETTIQDAGVFTNIETYEIELEIDNNKIGTGTNYDTSDKLLKVLKRTIKYVLSGLQGTNFPISYTEQEAVFNEYMDVLYSYDKKNFNTNSQKITPKNFIGPSSITLQIKNIIPIQENNTFPNIRKDYCVTEKADGERNLLFISKNGRLYLMNTSMNMSFTGCYTENTKLFGTIIDGELILCDKNGNYINLFASFDIYYLNGTDVRNIPFINTDDQNENKPTTTRYELLIKTVSSINAVSVLKSSVPDITIEYKKFYSTRTGDDTSIFQACNYILTNIRDGLYKYNTDGLILTPTKLSVGTNTLNDKAIQPPKKQTWNHSFKWKPPEFNTIDFLITTVKDETGQDMTKTIFEDGINVSNVEQLPQYKVITLRCGFDENVNGYINPFQLMLDDKINSETSTTIGTGEANYKPVQFYPTNPSDDKAGICNILMKKDANGNYQMFSENDEVITDYTIVEFKYDINLQDGFRWKPIRVRYDKTSELRRGFKNYGNSYNVANDIWFNIHNPITEEMITTGSPIPEEILNSDVYYNRSGGTSRETKAMRDFHNLFVKRKLISGVSKSGNTLIDYAVGRGGDIPKWIETKLSFVLGIDITEDNICNRLDGACSRYLNFCKDFKNVPKCIFLVGNTSKNIRNGDALFGEKSKNIIGALFGNTELITMDKKLLGASVVKHLGVGTEGFNISSIQFAIHYMFETPTTFYNFMTNISQCTKLGGYLIGTCFNGKNIFNLLKDVGFGDSFIITNPNTQTQVQKILQITKKYTQTTFEDDDTSIGMKIDVYQESINNTISEYLVNFEFLTRMMENYGFVPLTSAESFKAIGLQESIGPFSDLYSIMENIEKKQQARETNKRLFGSALNMTKEEKRISFLNNYFIYKKIREVDADKITQNFLEKSFSQVMEDKMEMMKMNVSRLNKKIIIVPDVEEIDETKKNVSIDEIVVPEQKIETKRTKKTKIGTQTETKERKPRKTRMTKITEEIPEDVMKTNETQIIIDEGKKDEKTNEVINVNIPAEKEPIFFEEKTEQLKPTTEKKKRGRPKKRY